MSDAAARSERDDRAFRRQWVWLAVIKTIVLVLIGLFIAFYML